MVIERLVRVVLLAVVAIDLTSASDWNYGNEDHWPALCRVGRRQSPIELRPSISELKDFPRFNLEGYGRTSPATMKNNGHSVEVRLKDVEAPRIYGGGLQETYELDHLHFHWDAEHIVNNLRYPLELHLVHHIKGISPSEAAARHHGVAVFAVFFEISPDYSEDFDPLVNIIDNLKDSVGEVRPLSNFSVKSFIPVDRAGFYRYEGSLTTPGCNEGITWTVFTNTLRISQSQVDKFKRIKTPEKSVLTQNYRSLQPLNDRRVYLKVSPLTRGKGSNRTPTNFLLYLVLSFIATFLNKIARVVLTM